MHGAFQQDLKSSQKRKEVKNAPRGLKDVPPVDGSTPSPCDFLKKDDLFVNAVYDDEDNVPMMCVIESTQTLTCKTLEDLGFTKDEARMIRANKEPYEFIKQEGINQ